ncbi:Sodium-potassium/proton antiporter ChaA [Pantoea sp. Nvir]|nr:Sodium-potassium/proton antiporter ChaA [Pantoea sp. Nvir]
MVNIYAQKNYYKKSLLILPPHLTWSTIFFNCDKALHVMIGINLMALTAVLSSAFSVVRHADVLAHCLGEPYGSLLLSLLVVILEIILFPP